MCLSQSDIALSSASDMTQSRNAFPGDLKSEQLNRSRGIRTMSTIQFDVPSLPTTTSSLDDEEQGRVTSRQTREHGAEKEEVWRASVECRV